MLNEIISQYLKSHKRLVIPGLGTFVVKDDEGHVIFTEMYRRDDGVLLSLLVESGVPELEAAGVVDRMVFEIRHAVQNGSSYLIEGLGVLRQGENGTTAFTYEPETVSQEPQKQHEEPAPKVAEPVVVPHEEQPEEESKEQPVPETKEVAPAEKSVEKAPETAEKEPVAEKEEPVQGSCCQKQLNTGRIVNTVETAFANEKRMRGDDDEDTSLDDLQYRRPYKNTDAYTYVNHSPRKKGGDRFIWVAIVAALLALAAIAFGYWNDMNSTALSEEAFIEETDSDM